MWLAVRIENMRTRKRHENISKEHLSLEISVFVEVSGWYIRNTDGSGGFSAAIGSWKARPDALES